jgi:hypothetical protein
MSEQNAEEKNVVGRRVEIQLDHGGPEIMTPIILSLGKKKQKQIKRLKRGKGRAMDEVMDVIDQVQANLGEQAAGKILVPVVVVYRKKERRTRGLF